MSRLSIVSPELSKVSPELVLIERKSRMPHIQGIKGEAVVSLLQALDKEGDGGILGFPVG